MCNLAEIETQSTNKLIAALGDGDEIGLKKLRELAQSCPACMLAAIRQSGIQSAPDDEGFGKSVDFDFKKEKESFFSDINMGSRGGW
jgi:hypothetical protein